MVFIMNFPVLTFSGLAAEHRFKMMADDTFIIFSSIARTV